QPPRKMAQGRHQEVRDIALAEQAGQAVVADKGNGAGNPRGTGAMLDQDEARDGLAEGQGAPATQHPIERQGAQGGADRQQGFLDTWPTAAVRTGARYGRMGHRSLRGTIGLDYHDRTYWRLRCPV